MIFQACIDPRFYGPRRLLVNPSPVALPMSLFLNGRPAPVDFTGSAIAMRCLIMVRRCELTASYRGWHVHLESEINRNVG